MSNAHSGISHPFGAPHSGATPNDLIPVEAMALSRAELQAMQETYTPWVPPDAPLEDRMYPRWDPSKYDRGGYARASDAVDDFYREIWESRMERYTGKAGDVVTEHAFAQHADVQPWQADPGAAEPYYQVAVRPLDTALGEAFFGSGIAGLLQHADHMQLLKNTGENFGLFIDSQVRSDNLSKMSQYQALGMKYRAEYIDRARAILDTQWADYTKRYIETEWSSAQPIGLAPKRYLLTPRNCQHYVKHVLDIAEDLAVTDHIKLTLQ